MALAEPEAEPHLYYTNGQVVYRAHNTAVVPAVATPTVYSAITRAMYYANPRMYAAYAAPIIAAPVAPKAEEVIEEAVKVEKREAEAEADSDAQYYAAYPYLYGYNNYGYAAPRPLAYSYGYAARPYAYNYGYAAPYGYAGYRYY